MPYKSRLGFTLIEIMLVLVLLSLTAMAVISTIPMKSQDQAKRDAQSLYQRLHLLNEEAILSGRDFGLRVDEAKSQYTLLMLGEKGWEPLDLHNIPSETKLKNGVSLSLRLGGGVWQQDDRLFNPGSLFDDDMFSDVENVDPDKPKPIKPPQVFIFSSAELTAFQLTFTADDSATQQQSSYNQSNDPEIANWRIIGKDTGELLLLAPGEVDPAHQGDSL